MKLIKTNAVRRDQFIGLSGLPLWTDAVGKEAICLSFFPLLLRLAVPGIAVATHEFVDCVYCVGGACRIVYECLFFY
jgi:hypothetical protein